MFGKKVTFGTFQNVLLYGIGTAFIGLISGFIFGWLIGHLAVWVSVDADVEEILAPVAVLSMGVGSLIGAIFGGIIGYKK